MHYAKTAVKKFTQRVDMTIILEQALLSKIDHWRFLHRINNRSEAVRQLIQLGLANKTGAAATKNGAKRKKAGASD